MSMELILGLAIGAVLGAVVGWLVCQSRLTKEQGRLREALARLEAQLEAERKRFEDSQKVLNEAEARFRETFQALSSEALKSNNVWVGHLRKLGKGLEQAVGCYNSSIASLESRVLVSARKFTDLGVAAKESVKQVPRELAAAELTRGAGSEAAEHV